MALWNKVQGARQKQGEKVCTKRRKAKESFFFRIINVQCTQAGTTCNLRLRQQIVSNILSERMFTFLRHSQQKRCKSSNRTSSPLTKINFSLKNIESHQTYQKKQKYRALAPYQYKIRNLIIGNVPDIYQFFHKILKIGCS